MNGPSTKTSEPICLRVWGERACFTRPEMKVERVSYDVMTPSAARGVLEAVLWKPQMRWIVERIDVLKPIRKASVRRNEVGVEGVGHKISVANVLAALAGRSVQLGINADDENARQPRASIILRDVDYLIHARIALTERAGSDDPLPKYVEIFRRRAAAGQCFHRPYLGTREFPAEFVLAAGEFPAPIADDRVLGWMLCDIDYSGPKPVSLFFEARLVAGSLAVPEPNSQELRR
jgi:CRISPR-associated protein Cas5d